MPDKPNDSNNRDGCSRSNALTGSKLGGIEAYRHIIDMLDHAEKSLNDVINWRLDCRRSDEECTGELKDFGDEENWELLEKWTAQQIDRLKEMREVQLSLQNK
jgi:hypothetical protein